MSITIVRVTAVGFLATFASLAIAQKYLPPRQRPHTDGGKVASVEEADFTRFRVVTDQGILAVFDADEEWDGRDEPFSQLAYWNDFASEQLFFFDQLLFTEADVLQSIAAMQRDLQIDPTQILSEKPDLDPLPEVASPGQWRLAIEFDVLAVMSGGNASAGESGGVSGLASPCVPGGCDPAAAAASGPIAGPVRGTSKSELFASAQRGSNCSCGGGPGPGPAPDPFRNIHPLAEKLGDMEHDLLRNHFDPSVCPFTELTQEVVTTQNGLNYATTAPIRLTHEGVEQRTGSVSVTTTDGSNSVNLEIMTTFDDGEVGPDPQWTLNQTVQLIGAELRFNGSIGVVEASGNSYSLSGGWTYSAANGAVIAPSSAPEFQNALADMQGFETSAVASSSLSPGAILSLISNAATIALNYLRDAAIPYAASASCIGPARRTDGQFACGIADISCWTNLDDIALAIDGLTMVSPAFKKCMKGRFDCRKSNNGRLSNHRQLLINCDFSHYPSCGPCKVSPNPDGDYAAGCNLGGSDLWYCYGGGFSCTCTETVFHEASHACGALDQLPITAPLSSIRIGNWFREEARTQGLSCPPQ